MVFDEITGFYKPIVGCFSIRLKDFILSKEKILIEEQDYFQNFMKKYARYITKTIEKV